MGLERHDGEQMIIFFFKYSNFYYACGCLEVKTSGHECERKAQAVSLD